MLTTLQLYLHGVHWTILKNLRVITVTKSRVSNVKKVETLFSTNAQKNVGATLDTGQEKGV